jgi:hypothetical protein
MSDAEWLTDVAAHGMVRPSFVPPLPIRELRELTRYRKPRRRSVPGDRPPGEGTPSRHQAHLGGIQGADPLGAGHDRGADRRAA